MLLPAEEPKAVATMARFGLCVKQNAVQEFHLAAAQHIIRPKSTSTVLTDMLLWRFRTTAPLNLLLQFSVCDNCHSAHEMGLWSRDHNICVSQQVKKITQVSLKCCFGLRPTTPAA